MSGVVYNPSQDRDPAFNQEPGIAVVPGNNYQREMAKWELFPDSRWAFGNPGRPYRENNVSGQPGAAFPKMLYQARRHKCGTLTCSAPAPDPYGDWRNPSDYARADEEAGAFTKSCQRIVQDEHEYQRAMEAGWRESPQEAFDHAEARERSIADAAAHRNYEDRNMSEAAKREIAEALVSINCVEPGKPGMSKDKL